MRKSSLTALLILCAGIGGADQTPIPGVNASPFGSQTVWPDQAPLPAIQDRMQEAGIEWGRFDLCWWSICETTPGVYNFNPGGWQTDAAINTMRAKGIEPYPILCYSNNLYDKSTQTGREAFGEYCYQAALRYEDTVTYWEIWNEPNLEQFWETTPNARDYSLLAIEAASRIREANPDAIIIGGATSLIDLDYLETCIDNGLLDAVDIISVHPYRTTAPESIESEIATLRSMLDAASPNKHIPIWSGEWGYNSSWSQVSELGQAKALSRMMVNNLSVGIDLSIWFSTHPFIYDPNYPNDPQFGILNYDFTPRSSWQAMKNLNDLMPAPVSAMADPFSTSMSTSAGNMEHAWFDRGTNRYTLAVWLTTWPTRDNHSGRTADISMTVPEDLFIRGVDGLSGDPLTLSINRSGTQVTINDVRIYDYPMFFQIDPAPEAYEAEFLSLEAPSLMISGEIAEATVTFRNVGSQIWDSNTVLATSGPRGRSSAFQHSSWISSSRIGSMEGSSVPPGGVATFAFTVQGSASEGNYAEAFELFHGADTWFEKTSDDFNWQVNVQESLAEYAGNVLSTNLPVTVQGGQVLAGRIEMQNVGAQSWNTSVYMGMRESSAGAPSLQAPRWIDSQVIGSLENPPVARTGTGSFNFDLVIPRQAGNHRYTFDPLSNRISKTWFPGSTDDVVWNVGLQNDNGIVLLEAEMYDEGGQGVGYSDADSTNNGNNAEWNGGFRILEGVDLGLSVEDSYFVGWIENGEWLQFSSIPATPGRYRCEARVAALGPGGGSFSVSINGENATGTVSFDATGDWQNWITVDGGEVYLDGANDMRVTMLAPGWNLSWVRFVLLEADLEGVDGFVVR